MRLMDKEVLENHKRYIDRLNLYKSYGYDTVGSRLFILRQSQPLEGRILEVGTGKGHMSLVLARAGYSFVSVDISEEEQRFARLNARYYGLEDKIDFKIDDAQNLSFGDKTFDVVICICLMHHLEKHYKAIDEFLRVLKPEGKIILSDYSKEGLDVIGKVHSDEGRVHPYSLIGLSGIEDYLKQKHLNYKKTKDKHHEILIIKP